MTTITQPVRARSSQLAGVLAAIAGRAGWRLWWPVLPWLAVAGAGRAYIALNPQAWPIFQTSSGVLLLASLIAVGMVWLAGARFALGLGYGRPQVFGGALGLSLGLFAGWHLVSCLATLGEYRLAGPSGPRVFAFSNSFDQGLTGENTTLANGSWFWLVVVGFPVVALLIAVCCGILRGGLVAGLGVLVGCVVAGILAGAVVLTLLTSLLYVALGTLAVLMIVAAWLLFRRARG